MMLSILESICHYETCFCFVLQNHYETCFCFVLQITLRNKIFKTVCLVNFFKCVCMIFKR